jgi:Holliday junction DNA helicase RuvA
VISFIDGTVVRVGQQSLVVDVGPIGLTVQTTPAVVAGVTVGARIRLHTSLVVREDGWTLFGFADPVDAATFEQVQTVSGVGPRLAAAILSVLGPQGLADAIAREDIAALTAVPGIGRKGAQRLVLELKGSLVVGADAPATSGWQASVETGLISLGWSAREAASAAASVDPAEVTDPNDPDIAALLKAALRRLDRS